MSSRIIPTERSRVTSIALEICYPDGSLKSVRWGTTWVDQTNAIILIANSLRDGQSKYSSKRRLFRRPKWEDQATLVRQTINSSDQLICSARDYPASRRPGNEGTTCDPRSTNCGTVIGMVLNISGNGKRYAVEFDEQTLKDTDALIFPAGMNSSEKREYDETPDCVAVRRLVGATRDSDHQFAMVCHASVIGNSVARFDTNASCGLRGTQLVGPR